MTRAEFTVIYPDWQPENVVFLDRFMSGGGCMDGGGLPLGCGDMIEAAKAVIAEERSVAYLKP